MSRRVFLRFCLLAAATLAVATPLVAFAFQDNLFKYFTNPRSPFQTTPAPSAPDYAASDAWAVRPSAAERAIHLADETDRYAMQPAVFFVHPTTFWGGAQWNAAIDAPQPREHLLGSALPTYAGPFASVGPVWAPLYRQASLYASLTHHYDAKRARALAFEDVARAFEVFLMDIGEQRPFVLVGVEQGGLHVLGLLQSTLAAPRVRDRLVAAYVIEQATPRDLFSEAGPLAHLSVCEDQSQSGCVVTWGAFQDPDDEREIIRFRRRSMVWDAAGRLVDTADRALACVNPMTGGTNGDYAPARHHRGAVDAAGMEFGVNAPALPAQTSAQCVDGVLLVDRPASASLQEAWRWGGRFKPARANLFYADTAADVSARAAAYAVNARRAPPLDAVITLSDAPIHTVPEDGL